MKISYCQKSLSKGTVYKAVYLRLSYCVLRNKLSYCLSRFHYIKHATRNINKYICSSLQFGPRNSEHRPCVYHIVLFYIYNIYVYIYIIRDNLAYEGFRVLDYL